MYTKILQDGVKLPNSTANLHLNETGLSIHGFTDHLNNNCRFISVRNLKPTECIEWAGKVLCCNGLLRADKTRQTGGKATDQGGIQTREKHAISTNERGKE